MELASLVTCCSILVIDQLSQLRNSVSVYGWFANPGLAILWMNSKLGPMST